MLARIFKRCYLHVIRGRIGRTAERSTMNRLNEDVAVPEVGDCPPQEEPQPEKAISLEEALQEFVERAKAPWPEFAVSDEDFVAYVEKQSAEPISVQLLEFLYAEDLWLAFAVLQQDEKAIQKFDRLLQKVTSSTCNRLDISLYGSNDQLQNAREAILLGKNGELPRLATYSGKGRLRGWLQIVVTRDIQRNSKTKKRQRTLLEAVESAFEIDGKDPELLSLKQENIAIFRSALHKTIEKLSEKERLLLRCWAIDEFSTAQIGGIIGVHRLTVGRRINRLRRKMLGLMKMELSKSLRLCKEELLSLMRNIESRFEASLSAIL